jgi:hypothetical protein
MYFSQSNQSKILIDKWIEIASKPEQIGKADDRVLSMIFNSYKFLLSMKIIQLPIEYLWLSLDYDDRMLENIYDYNQERMKRTIFVEHPECLTTEETAAGAGASSNRTPKYYQFLSEYIVPVVEEVHEYLMFPTKGMSDAFRDYYTYMSGIQYINDGNPYLLQRGFVDPENPENNESPLYIIPYDDKLGNTPHPEDRTETYNTISDANYGRARNMNIADMLIIKRLESDPNVRIVKRNQDETLVFEKEVIALILRLLMEGHTVLYDPTPPKNRVYMTVLLEKYNTMYKDLEFVFVPILKSSLLANFFKPNIDTSRPMLFRPCKMLMEFMSMFVTLDGLSEKLGEDKGSYEFMSRVRIGYLYKPHIPRIPRVQTGSGAKPNAASICELALNESANAKQIAKSMTSEERIACMFSQYTVVLEAMAANVLAGGRRKTARNHRVQKRGARKTRTIHR